MAVKIRKLVTITEETYTEAGKNVEPALKKVAAVAVIKNPFAGRFVENLEPLSDIGEELGGILTKRAIQSLDAPVESYGKGTIVGLDGEIEHAGAIMHPKLGKPVREIVGGGKAIIDHGRPVGFQTRLVEHADCNP